MEDTKFFSFQFWAFDKITRDDSSIFCWKEGDLLWKIISEKFWPLSSIRILSHGHPLVWLGLRTLTPILAGGLIEDKSP